MGYSYSYKQVNDKIKGHRDFGYLFAGMLTGGLILSNTGSIVAGGIGTLYHSLIISYLNYTIKDCEEFLDLKEAYALVKRNILESINTLNLSNIPEIFAYISYLNKNGYLDYKKNTEFNSLDIIRGKDEIIRELSLNNHGSSISKSLMLADILNDSDLYSQSTILSGKLIDEKDIDSLKNDVDIENYLDDIINNGDVPETKDLVYNSTDFIDFLVSNKKLVLPKKTKKKDIDYAITISATRFSCYYLDIINDQILHRIDGNPNNLAGRNHAITISESSRDYKNLYFNQNPQDLEKLDEEIYAKEELEEARNKINQSKNEAESLYDSIQPELEKAEKAYQKILRS